MEVSTETANDQPRAYIVGTGIAGLAAAAYLIRDGGWRGRQITLIEEAAVLGGSLDGAGEVPLGYRIRGGRMMEAHYGCTWDLFSTIPAPAPGKGSVTDDIRAFTNAVVTSSRARLVINGQPVNGPPLELGLRHRLAMLRLMLTSESKLGARTIEQHFDPSFFATAFWCMWASMFAFQPWHSAMEMRRYQLRFLHLLPGFNRLEGIFRSRLNQYDSMVAPLTNWLFDQGARLRSSTRVDQLVFDPGPQPGRCRALQLETTRGTVTIALAEHDLVFITLGSMTDSSAWGTHTTPAPVSGPPGSAFSLWRQIAEGRPGFGRPDVFASDIGKSRWYSFTVTTRNPGFFEFMERYTGNPAGTGGLVTFRDSRWLLSIVLAHQPHFARQPDGAQVFWGYALRSDVPGDGIGKPIADCSGAEILTDLAAHLPLDEDARAALDSAICLPCSMPYITSQFMPRRHGDRPAVIPEGAKNFAFVGEFCELPDDCVFTVEYSIRSAAKAVGGLLGLPGLETPIYRGYRDPAVLWRAMRALA